MSSLTQGLNYRSACDNCYTSSPNAWMRLVEIMSRDVHEIELFPGVNMFTLATPHFRHVAHPSRSLFGHIETILHLLQLHLKLQRLQQQCCSHRSHAFRDKFIRYNKTNSYWRNL